MAGVGKKNELTSIYGKKKFNMHITAVLRIQIPRIHVFLVLLDPSNIKQNDQALIA